MVYYVGELGYDMSTSIKRISKKVREEYECFLFNKGERKLFEHIVGNGVLNIEGHSYPEIIYLDQSEAFFALYRQTGKENFFIIGRALRKAAHCLYREYHRRNSEYPINARFLNIVK